MSRRPKMFLDFLSYYGITILLSGERLHGRWR
jgi:hypothetical protein